VRRVVLPASLVLLAAAMALAPQGAEAQRHTYAKGQPLYPAYEGWTRNADGSIAMMFGYMNENWEDELDVPVGEANWFSPGQADQGQPTHFLPRRNRFIFNVPVPSDFEEGDEMIWTLMANGEEHQAYGTLREDLFVNNIVIMSETGALGAGSSSPEIRANIPPMVELQGETERSVAAGEALTLEALVTDDGQPNRESLRFSGGSSSSSDDDDEEGVEDEDEAAAPDPRQLLEQALGRTTATVTVSKRLGLHFTWFVYRGPGEVAEFNPPQIKPWEDTRPYANSPWALAFEVPEAPEDGRWVSEVTFSQPGTYVLRGRAEDGGLYTDVEVTVVVRGAVF
jgi:hypothetical protein